MPRIRSLKPEALQHRKVGRLSDRAFRLWVAMLTQADDEGRLIADPEWLRQIAWSYHPDVTSECVAEALKELATVGLVNLYSRFLTRHLRAIATPLAAFPSWHDHQKIDRPTPSRYPSPSKHGRSGRGNS